MNKPIIRTSQNLYSIPISMTVGKRVRFWFHDPGGRFESSGIVTEYIVAENCLTVRDDKDGAQYYIGIDQAEILKCEDCRFFSLPFCVRKSAGILEVNHVKYEAPHYVGSWYSCRHFEKKGGQ